MNKIKILVLCTILAISLLNGCSKQNEKQKDTTAAETSATENNSN